MAESGGSWDVFLAYASPDRERARGLYEALEAIGVKVCFDQEALQPGDNWHSLLPTWVRRSSVVVALLSASSERAHYQQSELLIAIEMVRREGGRLVPVRLSTDAWVPYGTEALHRLDMFAAEDVEAVAARIRSTVPNVATARRTPVGRQAPSPNIPAPPARRPLGIGLAVVALVALAVMARLVLPTGGDEDGGSDGDQATGALVLPVGDAEPTCTGRSDGVLRIGGLLPQTGDFAWEGPPTRAAAELAVRDVNAAGGVLDHDVELLPGDSGDLRSGVAARTVTKHLAAGVDAIVGAPETGVTLDVIDDVVGACRVLFSPGNTTPDLTTYDDDDLYFRTAPTDALQAKALVDLMLADHVRTVAVLARRDPYGEGLEQVLVKLFGEVGIDVVDHLRYDPEATDFSAEVSAVADDAPDRVVIAGFEEAGQIIRALKKEGITAERRKGIAVTDGAVSDILGEALADQPGALAGVEGTVAGAPASPGYQSRLHTVAPDLTTYELAPETYDAVVVTALAAVAAETDDPAAIARKINAVTRDGTTCTTFADCSELLVEGNDIDYDGLSGPLDFSEPGEPTVASFGIYTFGADNHIDPDKTTYEEASLPDA